MQQVYIYNTKNVSAQEEVNAMLARMAPRWRLSSIDTPERGEPFNKSASKRLAELASDGLSCHQLPEPLTHGRHVGYCEAGGKDVAMVLVREGLAAVCHNRSRAKDYAGAEREAMAAKRGIWSRGDYQRKRYCPA